MGPSSKPGNPPGSDLFRRITLPASHDDFMPKGKKALSSNEVKLIELWIGAGASDTLAKDAIKDAPADSGSVGCRGSNFSGESIQPPSPKDAQPLHLRSPNCKRNFRTYWTTSREALPTCG